MIIDFLTATNYESNFKKLGANKQYQHYAILNRIDDEPDEFTLSIDIDIDAKGNDHSTIIKMHRNVARELITDSTERF